MDSVKEISRKLETVIMDENLLKRMGFILSKERPKDRCYERVMSASYCNVKIEHFNHLPQKYFVLFKPSYYDVGLVEDEEDLYRQLLISYGINSRSIGDVLSDMPREIFGDARDDEDRIKILADEVFQNQCTDHWWATTDHEECPLGVTTIEIPGHSAVMDDIGTQVFSRSGEIKDGKRKELVLNSFLELFKSKKLPGL